MCYMYVVMYFWSTLFFFNDTPTTDIYTLSLHDALPISGPQPAAAFRRRLSPRRARTVGGHRKGDQHSGVRGRWDRRPDRAVPRGAAALRAGRLRHADDRYGGPFAHRRRADGRVAAHQGRNVSGRNALRRRRYDRTGRGQEREGVP